MAKKKKKPTKKLPDEKSKKRKKILQKKSVRGTRKKSGRKTTGKNKPGKKRVKLAAKVSKVPKTKTYKQKRKSVRPTRKAAKSKRSVRSNKKLKPLLTSKHTSLDYRNRKFEYLHIDLSRYKKFKTKIQAIRQWSGNGVPYFLNKESTFPKAFMVILITYKKGPDNTSYDRANKLSPPEMNVDIPNIKTLILEYMVAFQDNFIEYVQDDQGESDWVFDPANITGVDVRFFY